MFFSPRQSWQKQQKLVALAEEKLHYSFAY